MANRTVSYSADASSLLQQVSGCLKLAGTGVCYRLPNIANMHPLPAVCLVESDLRVQPHQCGGVWTGRRLGGAGLIDQVQALTCGVVAQESRPTAWSF
jgi:hypothetical protein